MALVKILAVAIVSVIFLLTPLSARAQFGSSSPFPDNITFRDDGVAVDGTGKIIDLRDNLSVTYDSLTSTWHLAGSAGGSVSDLIYGAGWDGVTTIAPSKNAVYDKIETIASGGDNITVNTTAATNANLLDNLYIDWALDTVPAPDDITSKFNYAETLAGNPALLTTECIFMADGLMCEGATADTIEMKLAFPDPATTDKTLTLPNATDTLVGKDTTDTLTNKTMTAASNVIDADTAVALASDPADCGANAFATTIAASGALTCASIADADVPNTITIDLATLATTATTANAGDSATAFFAAGTLEEGLLPDSATVTGWVLGTSTASSLASPIFSSNNADPADAGIVRLGNAESIAWEAAPAGTDITLSVDASEIMQVSGALNAVGAITGSNLSGTNTGDNTVATSGDSATAFFASGTIEHERGGLEADVSAYDGLIGITGGSTYNQTGTTTQIVIFDGAGAPTSAALSGDVTMSNAGVVTIGADKILESMLKAVDAAVDEECLTKEDTTGDFEWQACGGGGAPTDADYLVGTTNGSLSAEIVVGTTPGGELGGTWGTPTIDDTVTVTGWVMGASTATTPTAGDNDTSLATTAFVTTAVATPGYSIQLYPQSGKLPTSNTMAIDAGNSQWRGLFDATTDECVRWQGVLTPYNGGALQADLIYSMVSATSGTAALEVYVMCISGGDAADVDTDSFGTLDSLTGTVPGTAGFPALLTDTSLNGDTCAQDDLIIVKVCRDADGSDTATGDLEFRGGSIHE